MVSKGNIYLRMTYLKKGKRRTNTVNESLAVEE